MSLLDWLREQYPPDDPSVRGFTWGQAIALADPRVLRHFLSRPTIVVESFEVTPMDPRATRAVGGLLFGQGR